MRRPLAVLAALLGAACGLGIHEPTGPCGEDAHVGPTPQQLAFVSDARFGQFDICLINVDGTAVAQLTTSLGNDSWPAWKPDGTRLAFQSYRTLTPVGGKPQADIFVINVDGTGETQLTTDTTNEAQPAWSPDSLKIAFHSDRAGNFALFVMNADGTNATQLTDASVGDELPAWSPDGTHLVYDTDGELWVIRPDGSEPRQVTHSRYVQSFMARWRP